MPGSAASVTGESRQRRCIHSQSSGCRRTCISSTSVQRCVKSRMASGESSAGGVDRVLVDQAVTADAVRQREHGDDGRAGPQGQHAERERRGRRPVEEVHGDRVGRLDVLVDQDGHAVVGAERLQHPAQRAPPVDHVVALAAAHPLEQIVQPAVVERAREHADGRERRGVGDGVDLPVPEVAGEQQRAPSVRARVADALAALDVDPGQHLLAARGR